MTADLGAERVTTKRHRLPWALKRQVMDRDDWSCVQCGTHRALHVDHILPVSKGGSDEIENLQTLCESHNLSKGTKTADYRHAPTEAGLVGQWFHTWGTGDDGCHHIQYQGQILAEVGDGVFLVEHYEWMMGSPHDRQLAQLADMADWTFYADAEWMQSTHRHQRHLKTCPIYGLEFD